MGIDPRERALIGRKRSDPVFSRVRGQRGGETVRFGRVNYF